MRVPLLSPTEMEGAPGRGRNPRRPPLYTIAGVLIGFKSGWLGRETAVHETEVSFLSERVRLVGLHMQTEGSVGLVRRAKERGVPVSCEVDHWALFLSRRQDIEKLGPCALSC